MTACCNEIQTYHLILKLKIVISGNADFFIIYFKEMRKKGLNFLNPIPF